MLADFRLYVILAPHLSNRGSGNTAWVGDYRRAENGNVAVTGEVDLGASDGVFDLALGFGPTAMEAGQHACITCSRILTRRKPPTSTATVPAAVDRGRC